MDFNTWIITGALGILITVLGFLLKTQFSQIIGKLDEVVREIKVLGEMMAVHDQQIKFIQQELTIINKRLNDQSIRIRSLEISKTS